VSAANVHPTTLFPSQRIQTTMRNGTPLRGGIVQPRLQMCATMRVSEPELYMTLFCTEQCESCVSTSSFGTHSLPPMHRAHSSTQLALYVSLSPHTQLASHPWKKRSTQVHELKTITTGSMTYRRMHFASTQLTDVRLVLLMQSRNLPEVRISCILPPT
jgi:hypothetical protein